MEKESFDFIFFDPYHIHPTDLPQAVEKIISTCKPGGKAIVYTYRDVLRVLSPLNLFKLRKISWVGDMLPGEIKKKLERIDHPEVSIGVLKK
ncbi:class I SAM-dependent methyltransferase [Thermococcus sp.]|uniref:class I SAM-dependent methyltransferase n=1 Tax=Thermococcus sp. TaxID=35749 RepID=UPI0025DF5213|nr:class I SAM-dependent methyltransferase [Thermococcus sp.]